MAKSGDDGGRRGHGPGTADEARIRDRLARLGRRLSKAKSAHAPDRNDTGSASGFGYAMRMAIDMVAGIVVGGAIGWFLDQWLGTEPILLLLVGALGLAAGFMNVARTYRAMVAEAKTARNGQGESERERGEDLPAGSLYDDDD